MAKQSQEIYTTSKNISFTLIRKQVKNIGLKVRTTGLVQVTANPKVPLDYIMNLVDEKSDWINKHVDNFKQIESNTIAKVEPTYESGDVLNFLGREYTLLLKESNTNLVYIENSNIYLNIESKATLEKKSQIIEKWYREQCVKIFQEVLDKEFEVVKGYILNEKLKEKPALKLRKMKSCWGVCHFMKSYIVLNTELIKYDYECIRYVVLHELMHFRHPNHSKDFYNSLSYFMPNYKEIKSILKIKK